MVRLKTQRTTVELIYMADTANKNTEQAFPSWELEPCWFELMAKHCFEDRPLIAFQLAKTTLPTYQQTSRLGTRKLHSLSNYYTSTFCGEIVTECLFTSLMNHVTLFQENQWDSLILSPVDERSPQLKMLLQHQPADTIDIAHTNWYADVRQQSFEEYWSQRPSQLRNTVKRKRNKCLKAHDVRFEIVQTNERLKEVFPHYKTIYQKSWKGEEGSYGFIEALCQWQASRGQLRLGIMWIDQQPAAAQIWFCDGRIAGIFKLAYDPQFKAYSPGSLLSYHLSEHVLDVDHVDVIDFLTGDDAYKRDWMTHKQYRYRYTWFNKHTIRGRLLQLRHQYLPSIVKGFKSHVTERR